MDVLIELTEEEKVVANSYAKMHSCSLEEAFKRTLFDLIEEEYDVCVAEEAYKEYLDNPKTYTLEEV